MPDIQQPRTQLPGLEYMALSPNANVALSGRRRFVATTTAHNAPGPANTITAFTDSFLIESQAFNNQGIYIHQLDVQYIPNDASGKLQILASNMGASLTTGAIVVPLGQALATQLSPAGPITALTERDKIVLVNDISAFDNFLGVVPTGNGLSIVTAFTVQNNDAAAHSFLVRPSIVYAFMNGVIE